MKQQQQLDIYTTNYMYMSHDEQHNIHTIHVLVLQVHAKVMSKVHKTTTFNT
jgi:hypothetical protein